MGISCAAYPFKIDMRVFTPKSLEAADSRREASRKKTGRQRPDSPEYLESESSSNEGCRTSPPSKTTICTMRHQVIKEDDDGDEATPGQMVLIPDNVKVALPVTRQRQSSKQIDEQVVRRPAAAQFNTSFQTFVRSPDEGMDSRFFSHFLNTVSTLLIVYDNPHNANPYRLAFPALASDSAPLQEAMNALGALHLANTTPSSREVNLKAMAISRYSRCVHSLREVFMSDRPPKLADLATVLLLTFFEMMDSDTNNWQTHLRGAKDVFERLFNVSTASPPVSSVTDKCHAVRNFLISALAYLDVAGAASTAQTTQLEGAYWDRVGGGWQYNLGVPSLNALLENRAAEDDNLDDIRRVWSEMMTIQADVGLFAMEIERGTPQAEQDRHLAQIFDRMGSWRAGLPDIFFHLEDETTDRYHADSIEGASCVVCYEQATIIYFNQVAGTNQHNPCMDVAIDKILRTFVRYGRGVSQMGMLWALFIAGTETTDLLRQDFVRNRMQNMLSFGLGNVKRALQLLELVWLRRRQQDPEVRWFMIQRELQWTLLLP